MLDSASLHILRALQDDSRQSVQELATRIGLSSTPCWRRIKAMEAEGIIRGYTAVLDREKLGLNFCVWAQVSLTRHAEGSVETFEAAMRSAPEVIECIGATGDADYMIKVVVPDAKAYDTFIHNKIFKLGVVGSIRSNIALRDVKNRSALPV